MLPKLLLPAMRAELITGCRQENAPSEEQAHGNLPYNPQVSLALAVGSNFRHSLLTTCCCLETKHDGEHVVSIDLVKLMCKGLSLEVTEHTCRTAGSA